MILIDTSAWIEFLRDSGSRICVRVEVLLEGEIATCDAVREEVLAGVRDEGHLRSLHGLIARTVVLPTGPSVNGEVARLLAAAGQTAGCAAVT